MSTSPSTKDDSLSGPTEAGAGSVKQKRSAERQLTKDDDPDDYDNTDIGGVGDLTTPFRKADKQLSTSTGMYDEAGEMPDEMKRPSQDDHETMTEADVSNIQEIKEGKEGDVISYDALGNILCDFTVEDFDHNETDLLVTPSMTNLFQKLEASIKRNRKYKSLLQGPSGVGKTTNLVYIGHMARAKGYLVFPMQAREFVNQKESMSALIRQFLLKWIDAVGAEVLREITPRLYPGYASLFDIANESLDDGRIVKAFGQLVQELKMCQAKPVVFLIDQCNAFHASSQAMQLHSNSEVRKDVPPDENPAGAMFLDWNTFKVQRGGIFYAFSSAFQLMGDAHNGNARLFFSVKPMNAEKFQKFIDFLINQNRLPASCGLTHFQDFFELCGGIPREACAFGERLLDDNGNLDVGATDYQQWKDGYLEAQIPLFERRIHRLLNKDKLGPGLWKKSVPFAASLFVGGKQGIAPQVWIASGLIVTTDGFPKLFCTAAEKAILSVFEDENVLLEAIQLLRSDASIKWRSLELAVVYRFRHFGGSPIDIGYTDLFGENEGTLTIRARSIMHGGANDAIPKDTLFVCPRNTPAVDFFVHDASGLQVLIQVSESSYAVHRAKYDPNEEDYKKNAAREEQPSPNATLQYIYLTSDNRVMRRTNKNYRGDVLLVAGANLNQFLGNLADAFIDKK